MFAKLYCIRYADNYCYFNFEGYLLNSPNWCVVILSFNHPEWTRRCVESVLRQKLNVPIYLVHNGSQRKFVSEMQSIFSAPVEHLIFEQNTGYSGGANRGLSRAFERHEWVLFVTNDCELIEIKGPPVVPGIYAPLVLNRRTQKVDSIGGALKIKGMKLRHLKSIEDWSSDDLLYVPGSAFWIDQSTWMISQGGFLESLGSYWEDVELSLRIVKKGGQIGHWSSTSFLHGVGKTCRKDNHYTLYLFQRNKRILMKLIGADHLQNRWLMWLESVNMTFRLIKARRFQDLKLYRKAIKDSYCSH